MFFSYWTTTEPTEKMGEVLGFPQETLADWVDKYPSFRIFTDSDLGNILPTWGKALPSLFERIRLPACRSDLARLLLLYEHGGVYVDSHTATNSAVRLARVVEMLSSKEAVFFDRHDLHKQSGDIHLINSVIIGRKNSEVLKLIILKAIQNLEAHDELESLTVDHVPYNIFVLTGPWHISTVVFDRSISANCLRSEHAHNIHIEPLRPDDQSWPFKLYQNYSYRKPGKHWSERQSIERLFAPRTINPVHNPTQTEVPPAMTEQTIAAPLAATEDHRAPSPPNAITVIANCQSLPLADALALCATGITTAFIDVNFPHHPEMAARIASLAPRADELVFSVNLSAQFGALATERLRQHLGDRLVTFTNIHFTGLHPDITYLGPMGARTPGYFKDYHSKLVLFGYATGRSASECVALFSGATYQRIGYFDEFESSGAELKRRDESCQVRYAAMFLEQIRQVPGLYTINHPTGPIFMALANLLARAAGVPFERFDALFLESPLARNVIWPVYNEIAEQQGLRYRMPQLFVAPARRASRGVVLADFVAGSYQAYGRADQTEFNAMVRAMPFYARFASVL